MSLTIHTVVSRPGPVERRVLERLSPTTSEVRRIGAGVALRVLETPQVAAPTRLALVHGRGHAATLWEPILRAFAPERRVVAPDLPGFGHSGFLDGPVGGPEDALDRFVAPIEDLLAAEGPIVLVGHSLGGLVSLEIALRRRVDVRGLVLVASMGLSPYVSPTARAYLRFGPERAARLNRFLGRAPRGLTGAAVPELGQLRVELHLARHAAKLAKPAFDALVPIAGDGLNRRDRLGEVRVPTLLVWGSNDEAFPLPIAMDAETRLADAELAVIGEGHTPHLAEPDAVIDRLRAFLSARGL
ncbi:MAG: alpha/beta hydrolase [Polyangiaceae bacterium]|nr:alpha/beta hydrolase [Polyangiaceae bacterium]